MDCALIGEELVSYQLGTVDDETRDRIDEHLCGCASCLRAYLRLKRAMERGQGDERPSARAKARLRGAVEAAFRPTPMTRLRRGLAKPVPLYQTLALAACVAFFLTELPRLVSRETRGTTPIERVDTARPVPASLRID